MHKSAKNNCIRFYDTYGMYFNNPKILDVGSFDVNGSLRDIFPDTCDYVGIDQESGKNVDIVLDNPYKFPFENESFDIVVSSSCFEHVELFWVTFLEAMRVLKPKGLLYINAPTNGRFHRHPIDCWRFFPDSGQALETWAHYNNINAALLESFVSYREEDFWNDFVGVFLKDDKYVLEIKKRITDDFKDFWNGRIYGSKSVINEAERFSK